MRTVNSRFVYCGGVFLLLSATISLVLSLWGMFSGIGFLLRNDFEIPADLLASTIGIIGSSAVLLFVRRLIAGEDQSTKQVWPLYLIGCSIGLIIVVFAI